MNKKRAIDLKPEAAAWESQSLMTAALHASVHTWFHKK
jgi:hypothetical protein